MPKKKKIPFVDQVDLFDDIPNVDIKDSIYETVFSADSHMQNIVCCRNNGLLFESDSIKWLKTIADNSIDLIFLLLFSGVQLHFTTDHL